MSMATMNPAAGGPVGGMMIMNNGSPAVGDGMRDNNDRTKLNLNGYIYDYLLKQGHYDIARSLSQDSTFKFSQKPASPGRRKDGEMNGDAGDGMDVDTKDDAPDDIPRPLIWDGTQGNGFLLDWFAIFSDLFSAHRSQNQKGPAGMYLQNERQNQKLRESMQNQNMNRNMNPAMMAQMRMANGKMPPQMTPQQVQVMQQKRAQQQIQMQMARGEGGEGDMNGVRPGTPAEGDGTGSPSKRPRMDNGAQNFPQGMMPNGRPAGVPGGPNAGGMLMQTGFAPNGMQQQFRQNGAMPPKTMPGAMPNGMMNMNMANASSPMMNQFGDGMQMDMYNRQNMPNAQAMQGGGGAAQSGNHALQDYQMQLMLLEQQNKKRLMMARQEQHENNPGAAGMPGVNMPAGMSPSGRSGTSPNPEMAAGRSPSAMNAFNMPDNNFNPAGMFLNEKGQPMMGGPNMRPPTSNMPPGARPGQFPGGQPMQQQGSQPGQQLGTPGQRTDMPPPQAPPNGAQRNGNSPQNQNQPPTPSQSNKANPKNKKNAAKEDNKKQRPAKKGSMANTQDDNPPATPTPSTPITPNNPGATSAANKGQANMQQQPPQQNMMTQPMQQNGMGDFGFGDASGPGADINFDFSTLEHTDVLENFDFDSFLNTSADDTFNFAGDVDLGNDFGMDAGQ